MGFESGMGMGLGMGGSLFVCVWIGVCVFLSDPREKDDFFYIIRSFYIQNTTRLLYARSRIVSHFHLSFTLIEKSMLAKGYLSTIHDPPILY